MGLGGSLVVSERPMLQGITSCLRMAREGVSELLWPTRCVLCDVPGTLLCDECRLELPYIDPLLACPFCGQAHGKFACVDCNSFIVKHRGLAPDQRDSTRGEHDVPYDVSRGAPDNVSQRVSHDVSHGASHNVPGDVSRHVSRQALGACKDTYAYCVNEETPVQQESVSQKESVSRSVYSAKEKNVSHFKHHVREKNVSRPEHHAVGECASADASQTKQHIQKPLDQVASVFELVDPCRKLITTYKDHKEIRLASVLAELLVDYINPSWVEPEDTAIVVIPARHQAIRERGFDHMKLIGEKLMQLTDLPVFDAIEPNERGDQRGLSASSRQQNMHDSFRPKVHDSDLQRHNKSASQSSCIMSHTMTHMPAHIILVDDVLTTGATLTSAAITLKQMGAGKVFGLTVARLP